jgi:hypothetical protein
MITKNKIIELPTNVGDFVYYIEFPTSANIANKEKPYIQKATVIKIEYANNRGYERIRVDFEFTNKYSNVECKWFIWEDGYLYTSEQDAVKHLNNVLGVA